MSVIVKQGDTEKCEWNPRRVIFFTEGHAGQGSWVAQKPIIDTLLFPRKPLGEDSDVRPGKDLFYFDQPVPIQSYLIAIVAGNIKSKQIGPRYIGRKHLSIQSYLIAIMAGNIKPKQIGPRYT